MASDKSLYEILGIDRTADARAIKKAYFALVRQFPPETHPDEFQELRRAYETLSDAEQRDRYDNAEKGYSEVGEEAAARLRAIEDATAEASPEQLLEMWKSLVADHPELAVARERLGGAALRSGDNELALSCFDWLVAKSPDHGGFHFQRGFALGRLGRWPEAEAAIRRALEIDPAQPGAWLGLSECLAEQNKTKPAISVLDEGLEKLPPDSPGWFSVLFRKAEVHFKNGKIEAADRVMDEAAARVSAEDDLDKRRYVAGFFATLAAKLFAKQQIDAGNRALARAATVSPEATLDRPYPVQVDAELDALPEAFQKHLAELSPGPNSPTLAEHVWPAPFFLTLAGLAGLFGAYAAVTYLDLLPALVLALASGVLLGVGVLRIVDLLRSPLRGFTTIRPLWVVRARGDRVSLYSIFTLFETNGTHHHTNGAYTHTAIRLTFGGETPRSFLVTIRNAGYAEAWLRHLWETRGRALELLAEGVLEAEDGADLLGPERAQAAEAKVRSPLLRSPLVVVGTTVLAVLGILGTSFVLGTPRDVADALASGSTQRMIDAEKSRKHPALTGTLDALYDRAARAAPKALAPDVAALKAPRGLGLALTVEGDDALAAQLQGRLPRALSAAGVGEVLGYTAAGTAAVRVVVRGSPSGAGKTWSVASKVGGAPERSLGSFDAPAAATAPELRAKVMAVLGLQEGMAE